MNGIVFKIFGLFLQIRNSNEISRNKSKYSLKIFLD